MLKKFGVAVVGLGRIARRHIQAIKREKRCELIALCSRSKEKASEWSHKWGVKYKHGYDNYEKMIKRNDIDIVYICTPNKFHKDQTIIAAEAGKNILLEKPIAPSPEESKEMIKTIHKTAAVCLIGNEERFNPQAEVSERLANKGILGDVFMARALFLTEYGAIYQNQKNQRIHWRFDRNLAGAGEFLDDSAKRLDTFRWITKSDVKRVVALSATGKLIRECETDDVNLALMEFTNGAWGCFGGSYFNLFPFWPLEIYGTKASLFLDFIPPSMGGLDGRCPHLIIHSKKPAKKMIDIVEENYKADIEHHINIYEHAYSKLYPAIGIVFHFNSFVNGHKYLYPYQKELAHLIDAITKEVPLRTPIGDYYKTLEAIWAAYRSAQIDGWVNLPLIANNS